MMSTTTTTRAILFLFVAIVGMTNAFAPIPARNTKVVTTSALQFGFLKELGLEKPSWLPDFGGKKEEEEAPAPAPEGAEEDGEAPAEEASEE
jgi:hypothetical protein